MKTRSPSLKLLPMLMTAIITASSAHSAFAQGLPTITLTEVSSTELDYSWDAAGGMSSGKLFTATPDSWGFLRITGPTLSFVTFVADTWQEPENTASSRNNAGVSYLGPADGWFVTVGSDEPIPGFEPDGATSTGSEFSVVFHDNAATSEVRGVPDSGSTFGLLALALAALFGATRLRSIRLA